MPIIINGFWSKLNDNAWPNKMKDEFLKHLDCNVIVVNWTEGSCDFYHNAHKNTRIAAIAIEKFIRNLQV
ncbi:unnamed protein product [Medioppia subpectinata]|uniref:Lipase domain-containing protein n=1 Tax=Medioppia subpectinata TaxID=1979941 RepID=A0A7R9LWN1_9ACAR|nr:unnamed protein product [Medioppia subpectinata]CAG2122365.1 unnamed protein product [Medioppia subpectinata]